MYKKPSGTEVANDFLDMLNVLGGTKEQAAFVDTILNSHRTLQQSACGAFLKVFEGWAEMKANGYYDLRNEGTVNAAQRIVKAAEDSHLPLV